MRNDTLDAKRYTLTIGWLYHELMNTYGDRGNIMVLQKRCEWRGILARVKNLDLGFKIEDLKTCDLLFMGGAQDRQQKIVSEDLFAKAVVLRTMIEGGTPGLFICGAYQFLGTYYKEADGIIIKGLGILDLYTENPGENHERLIGNIVIDVSRLRKQRSTLVGFENHGGRTYLGKGLRPFGTVVKGFGNNGEDKTEGVWYKNSIGTYLHGPILPKNPHLADVLITYALEKKYLPVRQAGKKSITLSPLEDSLEWLAHQSTVRKLGVKV